jgi:hypothetical protein
MASNPLMRTLASAWVKNAALDPREETVLTSLLDAIRWAEPHAWEEDEA